MQQTRSNSFADLPLNEVMAAANAARAEEMRNMFRTFRAAIASLFVSRRTAPAHS